jgi:hypothetical protein
VTTTSRPAPKRTTQSGRSGPHPWPLGSSTCPWTSSRPTRRPHRPLPRPSCPATWRSGRRSSVLAPCHHHRTEHAISTQSATLRCTQMHSISSHERYSDSLRCTQMHSDSLRFTHSDSLRCTQMPSDATSSPVRHRRSEHSEKQHRAEVIGRACLMRAAIKQSSAAIHTQSTRN